MTQRNLDAQALLELIRVTLGDHQFAQATGWALRFTTNSEPIWRARAHGQDHDGHLEFVEEDGQLFCAALRGGRVTYQQLWREGDELKTMPVAEESLGAPGLN